MWGYAVVEDDRTVVGRYETETAARDAALAMSIVHLDRRYLVTRAHLVDNLPERLVHPRPRERLPGEMTMPPRLFKTMEPVEHGRLAALLGRVFRRFRRCEMEGDGPPEPLKT